MSYSASEDSHTFASWDLANIRALLVSDHFNDNQLLKLSTFFPILAKIGINVIILEVNYHFQFQSHPNLQHHAYIISKRNALEFTRKARKAGITIIPMFQILGNQSKGIENSPLLKNYPEFDATPGAFRFNTGLVTREWDPLNDKIDRLVFELLEEILEAFEAPALHIGMGEIFLLGHPQSPSTRYKNPAVLFAYVANVYRSFLTDRMNAGMLMWGDRMIDGRNMDFGPWESSLNGTWDAIDLLPRDVIVCPWHYKPHPSYPSIPEFTNRGFRVLPMSWNDVDAITDIIYYCQSLNEPRIRGFIFSTWNVQTEDIPLFKPIHKGVEILDRINNSANSQELNTG